jgi:ABC-type transporter Mla subunit MlaD
MAKKVTLNDIATILAKHGKEIRDLTASVTHVVKHMATKDDIADLKQELKGDISRVQDQVNSIEAQLRHGRYETRLGNLEDKVFGSARRS